jgi:hypothetical protein
VRSQPCLHREANETKLGSQLKLLNDVCSDWGATYTTGAAQYASNSQCQIDLANSSFTNSGNNTTANLRIRSARFDD